MKNLIISVLAIITLISCTKQPITTQTSSKSSINTSNSLLVGTWKFTQTYYNNVLTFPLPGQTYTSISYVRYKSDGTYIDSVSTGVINGTGTYTYSNNTINASNGVLSVVQLDANNLVYTNGLSKSYLTR